MESLCICRGGGDAWLATYVHTYIHIYIRSLLHTRLFERGLRDVQVFWWCRSLKIYMAVSKRAVLVAAAAISFFTQRYAAWAMVSAGVVWNTVGLFAVAVAARFCWGALVYPLLLSPLRHLPQAPVSTYMRCSTKCDIMRAELILLECQSSGWKLVEDFQRAEWRASEGLDRFGGE